MSVAILLRSPGPAREQCVYRWWFLETVMKVLEPVLDRVAAGGHGAAEEMVDRFGGLVWTLARRFCADHAEAEDAVQEIMADVWNSVRQGRYDQTRGSETTFVATIARRRLIDRLRRRRAPTAVLAADIADLPSTIDPSGEFDEDVRAALSVLEDLSGPQQTAIRLAVMQGLTHEQVAEVTGLPLGTVKTHIRRGLIRIRERMQELKQGATS